MLLFFLNLLGWNWVILFVSFCIGIFVYLYCSLRGGCLWGSFLGWECFVGSLLKLGLCDWVGSGNILLILFVCFCIGIYVYLYCILGGGWFFGMLFEVECIWLGWEWLYFIDFVRDFVCFWNEVWFLCDWCKIIGNFDWFWVCLGLLFWLYFGCFCILMFMNGVC